MTSKREKARVLERRAVSLLAEFFDAKEEVHMVYASIRKEYKVHLSTTEKVISDQGRGS